MLKYLVVYFLSYSLKNNNCHLSGDGPFLPTPLVGNIPLDAGDHLNFDMNQNLGSIPSGSALIS